MKKVHLICNSHIDPCWIWDWNEGIASAIATFKQAAAFCDEFDYIFCHNEAILYEWVELYDKTLFEKICKLIKEGKPKDLLKFLQCYNNYYYYKDYYYHRHYY